VKRFYSALVVGLVTMLTLSASALAVPPAFNPATDFTPAVESYANTLFDGVIAMLPVLLGIAATFTVLSIAVRAIKKWLGNRKATNAV
jgi:hypothetical protein